MTVAGTSWMCCRRIGAMVLKEFLQLRRDRITFATLIVVPLMQLALYGYAINTNPKHLPTAVLVQESSDVGRSIIAALQNTQYFKVTHQVADVESIDRLLASGEVMFAIEVPAGFERALRRGEQPALLVAADATDPVAVASALSTLHDVVAAALQNDHAIPEGAQAAFEIREHRRYNPAGTTQLNIVPGLLGTILTMSMLIFTALSVTREAEHGTMESLLAMPIAPVEIMLARLSTAFQSHSVDGKSCANSPCRSGAGRSTVSLGRTAPARPRPSACCVGCSLRMQGAAPASALTSVPPPTRSSAGSDT